MLCVAKKNKTENYPEGREIIVQFIKVLRLVEDRGQRKVIFNRDFKRNGQGMKTGSREAFKPL